MEFRAGAREVGINHHGLQTDFQYPGLLFPHGVRGIGAQVHDYLTDLWGIGQHLGKFLIKLSAEFNSSAQSGAEQPEGLLNQRREFDHLKLRRLLAAEGEDLADQLGGP